MNSRRVVRFIPVTDGDIVDLTHTALPGVGRKGQGPSESVGIFGVGTEPVARWDQRVTASTPGNHILLGYQPAPLNPRARKPYEPSGWLIVLVDEAVKAQPARLRRNAKAVA